MSFDGETILTFHVLLHVLLLNLILTSDITRYVYKGIWDGFRCEQGKHVKLDSFLCDCPNFLFFHHLTSSFILDCEIVKASNADNKREICIFS